MNVPILTLQQRARELGRIRIGIQVPTSDGKTRPKTLDRFRVTSASRPLIERVAELYGGEARVWDNNGSPQFEVITNATRLPVLVPPLPVSQYFELWSGGGCQRRCDGVTELLQDRDCLCDPDPERRECKPHTRLNVILRDVQGIGVWRLESHGYSSAAELPDVADFLARTGKYVSAWLSLEQRTAIRDGETHRWMVPILEVDITPAQLLAGDTGERPAIDTGPKPSTTGKAQFTADEIDMARNQLAAATSIDQLHQIWNEFTKHFVMPDDLRQAFGERGATLKQLGTTNGKTAATTDNVDTMWTQILSNAPEEWTTQDIEVHFMETTGVDVAKASADDMRRYLDRKAS